MAAYAAAGSTPALDLALAHARGSTGATRKRKVVVLLFLAGCAAWLTAGIVRMYRLDGAVDAIAMQLDELKPDLDAAMERQDSLLSTESAVRFLRSLAADRSRDRLLMQLLTSALPRDTHLLRMERTADGRVSLEGFAGSAARIAARLEQIEGILEPRLTGPAVREEWPDRTVERFTMQFEWRPARDNR